MATILDPARNPTPSKHVSPTMARNPFDQVETGLSLAVIE